MAVNLTPGAIKTMCFTSEELQPVLQVIDLKLVQAQQNSTTERYRLVLSDGSFYQQGMLATQKNKLVQDQILQKGSVVRLTQYVCNDVQNRKIIIIVDLEVMLEKCELIGTPVSVNNAAGQAGNVQPAAGQLGNNAGNSQYSNSNSHAGGVNVRPNVAVPSIDRSNVNPSASSVYSNSSEPARYGASNAPPSYAKPEPGVSLNRSAPVNSSYGEQNASFRSPQYQASNPVQNSFARPPQPMNRQPSPMYTNRGPTGRNDAPPRILQISALNPYQNNWTIKARVTTKGELRHYSNTRGDGKVFSFDLLDSYGGEIRATCFNAVADQFYNEIEVGKVYLVSRGSVKPAQKNFNHLPNEYEITLDMTSVIQPCLEDDNSIPKQRFNFRSIGDVESMENNSYVDLIAVVTSISPTASIIRKNGTETQKRSLQLKDMSGRSVELTLWGNFCNSEGQRLQNICDSGEFPILSVKSARVNDFNGKSVGTITTSQLIVEPDFPEALTLKEWFDKEGRNVPSQSISRESSSFGQSEVRKTVNQIKDENLGTKEKPDWISICANIAFIKGEPFCYTACPIKIGDRQCNKKVTNNGDGKWRCDRCDQSFDDCDYRYLLQLQIQDHTAITRVTAFQEGGEEIIGMPAKDLYLLKYEESDDVATATIFRKALFAKYVFKLKVKEETFNDESHVKSTIVKAEKVNFASDSRSCLDLIDKLMSEKAEGTTINSVINKTGLGNFETGQVMPPVYNPIKRKIGAYKSFSEISPVLQFANFTSNQALLEAVEGYDRIHIIDFDIGFGGQWSSFMQELALRNGGAPALKITAFVSPFHHDEIELSFTHENLKQYAGEINMSFELEILTLESLNSVSWPQPLRDCEAVVVNLPICSFSNYPSYLPLVLRFVKQLMPKIVVTLDRSCDRTDAPFPQHMIFALQSYSGLLESLDAVGVNVHPDVLQMIEKYYLQPAVEKLVSGRLRSQDRTLPWKNLLLSAGFSPLTFSNFTESQAECLVQRIPGRGFHVEKKQNSLALCWQRKDLISVSTWRC